MRHLLLALLFTISACQPQAKVSSGASSGSSDPNAPYIWRNKTFPKQLNISSDFSVAERANITDMSTAWDTSVTNQKNFFSYGALTSDKSNAANPDDLYDSEFGVYKTTTWPTEIPNDALAVTQIFGRRYNVGDSDEFVAIEHADILVNYDDFDFDTNDDAIDEGYDLQTVVLHEMGHFLGLSHIKRYSSRDSAYAAMSEAAYKASSVMYPSISGSESKRVPQTQDSNNLIYKYISGTAVGAITSGAQKYQQRKDDPGLEVKVMMELKATGECVHKENGAVIGRHRLNLK